VHQTDDHATDFVLEDFVPYRLSLLSNTVSQGISSAYRGPYGLSVTEWRVIAVLGRFPGLTASQIVQRTAMDKVAISRAVNRLLQRNLLERSPQRDDRRRMPLRLTNGAGEHLFRSVVPRALDYERRLLAILEPGERRALDRVLGKLQAAADELSNPEN
jgi:DNA-binding MarR family transcriptional regulator